MGCDGSWDMSDDLLERLREMPGAAELFDALEDVPGVWVVGGAVRDALLGRDPRDLDLVVEGDAAEVARRLGEEPLLHERFGTATANGVVNLAAARRERYEQPGALPEVELGAPIAEDLARRDFTVNAIAVRLADGELQAVPGALEDLAARRLRVLHDGSFLDDPTRLLRLVRYAARLRFQIEQATARAGVRGGRGRRAGDGHALAAGHRAAAAARRAAAGGGVRRSRRSASARGCCRASTSTPTSSSARSA